MPVIEPSDLAPFASIEPAKAQAMIDDALAMAGRVAPCLLDDSIEHVDAARAILRGAILRWHEAGSGALQQQSAGPFQQTIDTRQARRGMFTPTELDELAALCGPRPVGAFTISTVPGESTDPWFGARINGPTQ